MNVVLTGMDRARDWDSYVVPTTHAILCSDTCGLVAVDTDSQQYMGGIVFDQFTPNSVQAHIVVSNPLCLRHGFLEQACDFVFNTKGLGIMYGLVPAMNEEALKFNKHIGFTEATRLKDGFEQGVDYVVMEMRKEDCRWIEQSEPAVGVAHG